MTAVDTESECPPFRVIGGSARSGTTWIQDALASANGLRPIFEPLHPDGNPRASAFAHRYAPPDTAWPELEEVLRTTLSGEHFGVWTDLRVRPDRLVRFDSARMVAGRLLTLWQGWRRYRRVRGMPALSKVIRGNLLLEWMRRHLGAGVVLLVRHPMAVVSSQLGTHEAAWHTPQSQLRLHLSDEALMEEHLSDVRSLLEAPQDELELRTVLWCIENAVPMRWSSAGMPIAFYERLLAGDEAEWQRVLDGLRLAVRPSPEQLAPPSQQASKDLRRAGAGSDPRVRWLERFASDERARVQAVLDRFGVTAYRTDDPMPRTDG